ncbi:helix-turn-helix domain-containing protein [Arthrobacter castelli]|uniref:helix-turn-helix domain-containing protein n=1 Tax=Arthrobacter castelli TaxID=271431 RepID=UPI0009D681B9|nr:helix-turn-helix domain-containing protein [Arthrobacter castelli]
MSDDAIPGLRVLAHPLRLQLLSILAGTAMSAAEAARELSQTQANVSYHLRRLQAAGLLVATEGIPVRGGRAKRYRHPGDSGEHLTGGNVADHRQLAAAMASELMRRAGSYRPGTGITFTDAEFTVRRRDFEEARSLARRLGEVLHNSASDAAAAAADPDSGTGTPELVKISSTLFLFELADGGTSGGSPDDDGPAPDGGTPGDPAPGGGSRR